MSSSLPGAPAARVVAALRELSIGLAQWRLHPGAVTRPEFTASCDRAGAATAEVTRDGPVRVRVHPERLELAGEPLRDDPHLRRLASACYERRVEYLDILDRSSPEELAALYAVWSESVEELDALGGAGAALVERGTTSIALWTGTPEPLLEARKATDDPVTPGPGGDGADILADAEALSDAGTLYDRLAEAAAQLSDDESGRSPYFEQAHEIVKDVDADTRAAFARLVFERSRLDSFAERYLSHLTDIQLARLILEVAETDDTDPVELAEDVVAATERHHVVTELVAMAVDAGGTLPEPVAPGITAALLTQPQAQPASGNDQSGGAAVGVATLGQDSEETRALRAAFPVTGEDLRTMGLDAFESYVMLEEEPERLQAAVAVAVTRLREACIALDAAEVRGLVERLEEAVGAARGGRHELLAAYRSAVLDSIDPSELAVDRSGVSRAEACAATLAPLGAYALDAVLDALAEEHEAPRRRALLSVASAIGGPHADRLSARLDDPRWYVVRNVVSILGQIGSSEVVEVLLESAAHADSRVRAEAVRALTASAAAAAPELLADLVREARDLPRMRRALDALANHPAPEAEALLATFASRGQPDRLPWRARRHARKLHRANRRDS